MSWDEVYRKEYPCPCGTGKYLEVHSSNDFNQRRSSYQMLCKICRSKYVAVETQLPNLETDFYWVLKSELRAKLRLKSLVFARMKQLYFQLWQERFKDIVTKKLAWEVLTSNGRYYPSLSTFYNHLRSPGSANFRKYISNSFKLSNLEQICDVLGTEVDWKRLGIKKKDYEKHGFRF